MTSKKLTIIMFLILTGASSMFAQSNPQEKGLAAITKEAVQAQLEFLASDWTEGRETTTKGEFIAGDYIASIFKLYGLKPAGDDVMPSFSGRRPAAGQPSQAQRAPLAKSYFQNIPFVSTEQGGEQAVALVSKENGFEKKVMLTPGTDYSMQAAGGGMEFTAPLIFVGYGYKNDAIGYNDFKGVDVKGKIIIRISGVPGQTDPESELYKKLELGDVRKRMAFTREKNETAQKLGVAGIIEIQSTGTQTAQFRGPRGGSQYANYPFRFNTNIYEGDVPFQQSMLRVSLPGDSRGGVITINATQNLSTELLKESGINVAEVEKAAASKGKFSAKEIKNKYIYMKTTAPKTKTLLGRNVVAMIEGENPNEVIVVGGHYDHMGKYNGYVWNGADDNASGTVGVMTIAKAIMATGVKPKRTIIFAAWTGEEKGLLGSQYFVNKYNPVQNIKLNLNYDMISRNVPADTAGIMVGIQYSQDWPVLKETVEKANQNYKLGMKVSFQPSVRPSGGSDFQSFSAKDIPVYGFMAAMHEDYHTPTDHVEKVDFKKMTNIIRMGFLAVWELANIDKIAPAK